MPWPACSEAGLVHNDLKPDNVLLACPALGLVLPRSSREPQQQQQRWKLVDFGNSCALPSPSSTGNGNSSSSTGVATCASLAEAGARKGERRQQQEQQRRHSAAGAAGALSSMAAAAAAAPQPQLQVYDTPSYSAPELALGLPPSAASDMWSLACSLFTLATGSKLLPVPGQAAMDPDGAGRAASGSGSDAGDEPLGPSEIQMALVVQLLGLPPARLLSRWE